MMKSRTLFAGMLFSLGMAAALPGQAAVNLDIDIAPPAPPVEEVPPPRAGYTWAPGYYVYNGHQHVWTKGRWIANKPGQHYVADHWDEHDGHYHRTPGHWER